jgi:hypothetical protein
LSLQATREVINQQLPAQTQLSMRTVQDYITTIKRESRNWIDKMALDVYEFVAELKERWDELRELKGHGWEMLDKSAMEQDIDGQIKAANLILKTNWQILEMDMLLPQIAIPSPSMQQQQSQELDSISDEEDEP